LSPQLLHTYQQSITFLSFVRLTTHFFLSLSVFRTLFNNFNGSKLNAKFDNEKIRPSSSFIDKLKIAVLLVKETFATQGTLMYVLLTIMYSFMHDAARPVKSQKKHRD
jgi:hypothetical protein